MVWQENIVIIVMTTNIRETGTMKCYPYWPMESKEVINHGLYQIQHEKSEKLEDEYWRDNDKHVQKKTTKKSVF